MKSRPDTPTLWPWLIGVGCLLVILLGLVLPRAKPAPGNNPPASANPFTYRPAANSRPQSERMTSRRRGSNSAAPSELAEQIVAQKAGQFAHSQREVLYGMARKRNLAVPPEVERFFEAAENGNWARLQAAFDTLAAERRASPHPPELEQLWGPILATFNGLEQVHLWPAQEYLDYGNSILNALRPGMVYVGGTDSGRGIPELLNATSDGERHIVITQNALADKSYLDYLNFLYGDKMELPTQEEVKRAFDEYLAGARERYLHDQQHPDEPKQLKPEENLSMDGQGKFSVSGREAIMAINELIFRDILQKNPDMTFGLEESYSLKSTYPDAAPLGPIMELRVQDGRNGLTADTAAQSLGYWQETAQQLLSDPAASGSPDWLKAYSKMAGAQANLFASRGLNEQAEQAFRLSLQIAPGFADSVLGYADLLTRENRAQDALAVAQSAAQAHPDNKEFQNLIARLQKPQESVAGGAGKALP